MTTSKIDAAIAKVTAGVKRLEKSERNSHGGYAFAGIDDFLAMTGKLCGDAGLSVIMDETDFEIVPEFFATKAGKVAGLRMKFAIHLRADGESIGPFHRSIMVPGNMGSQAFGAGQSYVLKQFLRATFQIPTGDKGEDIDAHDTGTMQRTPANDAPAKQTKLEGPHTSKTALKAALHGVMREIEGCGDLDQFEAFIAMPETRATISQCERDAPEWAVTGKDMPAEFVPLLDRISMTRTNLSAAANDGWRDDMTRAG